MTQISDQMRRVLDRLRRPRGLDDLGTVGEDGGSGGAIPRDSEGVVVAVDGIRPVVSEEKTYCQARSFSDAVYNSGSDIKVIDVELWKRLSLQVDYTAGTGVADNQLELLVEARVDTAVDVWYPLAVIDGTLSTVDPPGNTPEGTARGATYFLRMMGDNIFRSPVLAAKGRFFIPLVFDVEPFRQARIFFREVGTKGNPASVLTLRYSMVR